MSKYHLTRTAVFVILERDGKIFYLRRKNTGWNDGKWTVPSGHVDKGERIIDAAIREAEEEAGVVINGVDLEFIHTDYCFDKYTNFYFKAKKWEGEPKINEPHLAREMGWFQMDECPADTIRQFKHMLKQVKNGRYFSDIDNDDEGLQYSDI